MIDLATYLVTEEVALRSGMIDSRYYVADGRYVLNNRDLKKVRLTSEEYITGLKGIEKIDSEQARTLIARNKYKMGRRAEAKPMLEEEPMPNMSAPTIPVEESAVEEEQNIVIEQEAPQEQNEETPVVESEQAEAPIVEETPKEETEVKTTTTKRSRK